MANIVRFASLIYPQVYGSAKSIKKAVAYIEYAKHFQPGTWLDFNRNKDGGYCEADGSSATEHTKTYSFIIEALKAWSLQDESSLFNNDVFARVEGDDSFYCGANIFGYWSLENENLYDRVPNPETYQENKFQVNGKYPVIIFYPKYPCVWYNFNNQEMYNEIYELQDNGGTGRENLYHFITLNSLSNFATYLYVGPFWINKFSNWYNSCSCHIMWGFATSHVCLPDNQLKFVSRSNQELVELRERQTVPTSVYDGNYANCLHTFVLHNREPFFLRTRYSEGFGLTSVNGQTIYVKEQEKRYNNLNIVAIDEWGTYINFYGSDLDTYDSCLSERIHSSETSRSTFIISSNSSSGQVGFGLQNSDDKNPFYYSDASTDGAAFMSSSSKTIYVKDGILCRGVAKPASEAKFIGWCNISSGEFVGTSPNVSVQHNRTNANVHLRAYFSADSSLSKAVAVLNEGTDWGEVEILRGDVPVGSVDQSDSAQYQTYNISNSDTSSLALKATPKKTTTGQGLFLGWKRNPDDSYTSNTESLLIESPQSNTVDLYYAYFREAKALNLTIPEGVEVVLSAGQDDNGNYYEGNMILSFKNIIPEGQRLVSILINNSEYVSTSGVDVSFMLEAVEGVDVYEITPIIETITHKITFSLDDESVGHNCAISVSYFNDDGEHVVGGSDSPISIDVAYGTVCTFIIGLANDDIIYSVVSQIGDDNVDITNRFSLQSANRYVTSLVARTDINAVVTLGNTISVQASTRESSGETNGVAYVSLSQDGEKVNSLTFPYGSNVYLFASNYESEEPDMFFGWYDSTDKYYINPKQGWGVEVIYKPNKKEDLVALFGSSEQYAYVHIINKNGEHGDIELFDVGNSELIRISDEDEFIRQMLQPLPDGSGLPYEELPKMSLGGIDVPSLVPSDSSEKWYKMKMGTNVIVACVPHLDAGYSLDSIKYSNYTKIIGRTEDGEVTSYELTTDARQVVSSAETTTLKISNSCEITFDYANEDPRLVSVNYVTISQNAMGQIRLSPWPPFSDAVISNMGMSGKYRINTEITIMATSTNGYYFTGWYSDIDCEDLISEDPTYSFMVEATSPSQINIYAKFEEDTVAIYQWGDDDENMEMAWRSRRFLGTQPLNMSSASVCADGYPVEFNVHYASSPNASDSNFKSVGISINKQDPRRLPMIRPEKYFEVEVKSRHPILKITTSSSMGGLVQ